MNECWPQVVIADDTCHDITTLLSDLDTFIDGNIRPLRIAVTDAPTPDLMRMTDCIIAKNQLSYLLPLIATIASQQQKLEWAEQQNAELGTQNRELTTQIRHMEEESKRIELLKQAIVHGVNHELRTPMLQVKSAIALLNEDEGSNRTIIELAMGAIMRLESGIRNVTLLNELMNTDLRTDAFTPVSIHQLLDGAVRYLGKTWEHRQHINRIKIDLGTDNIPPVLCDRQRMLTAIQLLLDNALKFSNFDVFLQASMVNDQVQISVKDRGIGIAQDQLDRILEAFYQVDGSSTRQYGGMGIGLAIVRLILEQHQTRIEITSIPGKGSIFAFNLPTTHEAR